MLVAGEASGDLHGAGLCRALHSLAPEVRLYGMGGEAMAAAGLARLADLTRAAVVGVSEAVGRLPALYRTYRRLREALEGEAPPSALVLIDFPEFNLRLARSARRAGIPVVYFMPPQIWAWRRGRVRTIRRLVSLVLAVFPFETPLYRAAGVPVQFVGHPLLDLLAEAPSREVARRELGLGDEPIIGILPGSRREEVARLLPDMRRAAARIAALHPRARFLLGLAPTVEDTAVSSPSEASPSIQLVRHRTQALMRAADVLLVSSGTATLEAALLGTPMVACYRVSAATNVMLRTLIRVPWMSLANITLGRAVIPELYQRAFTAERLAAEAVRLLDDGEARRTQREAFTELARELGQPGVGARAARLVLTTAGAAA